MAFERKLKEMKFDIKYAVNRYAPEQSTFLVNGKIYAPRYSQLAHDLGCLIIEGKRKEAEDIIKRDIRKQLKAKRTCTIGFYEKDNNRVFYTTQLTAPEDDLQGKLQIFKEWKSYCESKNCIMATHEISEGSFIPGKKSQGKSRYSEDVVDLRKPVKIYLKRVV